MMKRLLVLLICLSLLSLAACGKPTAPQSTPTPAPASNEVQPDAAPAATPDLLAPAEPVSMLPEDQKKK